MSAFACGRCFECDGGRGDQFCLAPRNLSRGATLDEATTPHERLRQMAPELLAALVESIAAHERVECPTYDERIAGSCSCTAPDRWRAVVARATGGEP